MPTELPLWIHLLLVGAGFVAGFVNTVAGAGSALTIPALVISGVDAAVANASNRVAVVVQTVAGTAGFHRRGVQPWRGCVGVVPALLVGGLAGAWLATQVSPAKLQRLFGVLFVALALLLVFRPRWLSPQPAPRGTDGRLGPRLGAQLTFATVGLYGGFVQAGVGIPLLLALVQLRGLDIVAGNAAKTALTATFTLVALCVFQGAGQIDWVRGLEVAAGSLAGSLVGVSAAVRFGAESIRRGVIAGLILAALRMLGVF